MRPPSSQSDCRRHSSRDRLLRAVFGKRIEVACAPACVVSLVWCPFLLILKPDRRRAYDPSPVGRLCGRSEDDLYCIAAYPFDHVGDSAINTTRVVPDSQDYPDFLSAN
jgi:hypothetical protein